MVDFLANNSGMDISLITFHGFAYGGKTLFARQVHVEGAGPKPDPGSGYVRVAERRARLNQRVEESGVSELFGAVRDMFRANWPDSKMHPRASGQGLSIMLQKQSYARIDLWQEGQVWIVFQPCAKALCLHEFEQPVAVIPHGTWPHDRNALTDADAAVQFKLTPEDWETHKGTLTKLAQAVYEAHAAT